MYVANKLYQPSYISLETALSVYSIIPEVSMAVISLTTKPTRRFKNKPGLFIYHTIKRDFFCGYNVRDERGFSILTRKIHLQMHFSGVHSTCYCNIS